jgi:hypothetical protein
MTRRARKTKVRRQAPGKSRKAQSRRKAPVRDVLDNSIAAGAQALGLKIEKSWLPAVRTNLQVTLRLGTLVAGFALPDDTEPAPVFRA